VNEKSKQAREEELSLSLSLFSRACRISDQDQSGHSRTRATSTKGGVHDGQEEKGEEEKRKRKRAINQASKKPIPLLPCLGLPPPVPNASGPLLLRTHLESNLPNVSAQRNKRFEHEIKRNAIHHFESSLIDEPKERKKKASLRLISPSLSLLLSQKPRPPLPPLRSPTSTTRTSAASTTGQATP